MEYARRSIPSISGLIAFEATARHLSFSRAADDLALTQGAVSKRVRQLETVLGLELLARNGNQVCLTDVGQAYLGHVRKLLRQLQASTEEIRSGVPDKVTIRVAVPSAFASRWLVPRLATLSDAFPEHTVDLLAACSPEDPELAGVDCAIFDGRSLWWDADATLLASSAHIVVASPDYAMDRQMTTPQQLLQASLLRCNRTPAMWQEWFAATGHNGMVSESLGFEDIEVAIDAALQGLGVAIVPQLLVSRDLESGRLRSLFPDRPFKQCEYFLLIPQHSQGCEVVGAFGDWLASVH